MLKQIVFLAAPFHKADCTKALTSLPGVLWALQIFGGLIVGMVVKYADNILKNFANALSVIFTVLGAMPLFGQYPSGWFIVGVALVSLSVFMYGKSAPQVYLLVVPCTFLETQISSALPNPSQHTSTPLNTSQHANPITTEELCLLAHAREMLGQCEFRDLEQALGKAMMRSFLTTRVLTRCGGAAAIFGI